MKRILLVCVAALFVISCSNSPEVKVLRDLQKNYNAAKLYPEYVSKVFVSSYSMSNGEYLSFNDGAYYFVYMGESYDIPVGNSLLISDNVRKLNSREQYLLNTKNITAAYIQPRDEGYNQSNISEISDIPSDPDLYGIIRRMELYGVLSKKGVKNFDYKLDTLKDNVSLSFEPKDDGKTSGVIFFNDNNKSIDSIYISCESFSYLSHDWGMASYKILFDNNRVKSIAETMYANDILSAKEMVFIPETTKKIDYEALSDVYIIGAAGLNKLVLYNDVDFQKYEPYVTTKFSEIVASFGGENVAKEQFTVNNNRMFFNYEYQHKSKEVEDWYVKTDSLTRLQLDNMYGFNRWEYAYGDALVAETVSFNTTLKSMNNSVNFGVVPADTLLTAYFKYVNTGNEKLYLLQVKPDCDCTSYSIHNNGAQPQDTVVLELKYNTKGRKGVNGTYAIITANTPDKLYKAKIVSNVK